jgi:hypothetical protein
MATLRSVRSLNKALCGLLVIMIGSAEVRADLIPSLSTVTGPPGGLVYCYSVFLTAGESLKFGNYITIYDFAGFIPGSNRQTADWVFDSPNVGPTDPHLSPQPPDDRETPNLFWLYKGKEIDNTSTETLDLGIILCAGTTIGGRRQGDYSSQAQSVGSPDGSRNQPGHVSVPAPEPAVFVLMMTGLACVGTPKLLRLVKKRLSDANAAARVAMPAAE